MERNPEPCQSSSRALWVLDSPWQTLHSITVAANLIAIKALTTVPVWSTRLEVPPTPIAGAAYGSLNGVSQIKRVQVALNHVLCPNTAFSPLNSPQQNKAKLGAKIRRTYLEKQTAEEFASSHTQAKSVHEHEVVASRHTRWIHFYMQLTCTHVFRCGRRERKGYDQCLLPTNYWHPTSAQGVNRFYSAN